MTKSSAPGGQSPGWHWMADDMKPLVPQRSPEVRKQTELKKHGFKRYVSIGYMSFFFIPVFY